MEATLLLVNAAELPRGLEEQLAAKGAFVETTSLEQLEPAVIAVAPDLVVALSSGDLDRILELLGRQEPLTPLVLLADWKEHRALRARGERVIGAVLSRGTPAPLLAARITEFGERAARGEPLQRTPSVAPARNAHVPAKTPTTAARNDQSARLSAKTPTTAARNDQSTRLSAKASTPAAPADPGAHLPAEPPATTARTDDVAAKPPAATASDARSSHAAAKPSPAATRERRISAARPSSRPPPAARGAHTPAQAAATAAQPDQSAHVGEKTTPTTEHDAPTAPRRASSNPPPARTISSRPPPAASALRPASSNPPPAARTTSSRPPPAASALRPASSNPPPPATAGARPAHDLRPLDATSGGGEAAAASLSLTFDERALPPLRLGLVDTDLTRAGAVAEELRRRGVTTQLVSPDLEGTRWHLLRRLAPHGLVVDEGSLLAHAAWLEALRRDPFLRHVRVLVLPLARLFRESSGDVDLSALVPLLLPLDVEETTLRERLATGAEIQLRLDQLGVLRLLTVLGDRARPTRLTCVEGEDRLSWDLFGGRALSARLDGSQPIPLTAEQALDWLVAHPECQVHASALQASQLSPDPGVSLEELITQATDRASTPTPPPAPHRAAGLRAAGTRAAGEPSVASTDGTPLGALRGLVRSGAQRVQQSWSQLRRWVAPRWRELSPPRRHAALGVGVLLLIAPFVAALARGKDPETPDPVLQGAAPAELSPPEPRTSEPAAPTDSADSTDSAPAPPAPPPPDDTDARERQLFQVSPDVHMSPCDESVSVAGESRAMASRYLHRARKQLVAGNVEEARLLMCKAALLEPAGPASEGLAQLYLTDRSLANAQHWAEIALQHDPKNRSAQELLGDIANQRGDVAKARRHWLATMQLTGAETAKLEAVSRSHTQAAQRAVRSSDLPRAERFFRRAVTLDPKNATAAAGLAQVLFDLEQREGAQRWAQRARELDPASVNRLGAELRALLP
ncbi:MAG: tetratricopeptide repeat protein [Myxococcales bacterium]|nr:tetratricopeptide repeat protein [Myxococcales bacterium]